MHDSKRSRELAVLSLCEVREHFKLGCVNCVLYQCKECPRSGGVGVSAGSYHPRGGDGVSSDSDLNSYAVSMPSSSYNTSFRI